jgi:galactokinase
MEIDLQKLAAEFRTSYGSEPRFFQAPGRVNLIGEHTDYNEGFVMPFAIDRRTFVAAAVRDDFLINVHARDLGESETIDLTDQPRRMRRSWVDYVEGTARSVAKRIGEIRGADMIITSNVPIGAGLSSSAAIEIAVGLALVSLSDLKLDPRELGFAGQQAEHEFVGTRSGIMDQFASIFGRRDNAMLLDCRSLEIDYIPVVSEQTELVVIDTKVKHNLASSEYNTRREECEKGVELLRQRLPSIHSLRDVSLADLEAHADLLPANINRRCRHVVSENVRTVAAAQAFRDRDVTTAGRLMFESHRSLRVDYEVSCRELDFLVETAREVEGVFGSRMTGGGFGGSTISLVASRSVERLRQMSVKAYSAEFGIEPDVYLFHPADGASEIVGR